MYYKEISYYELQYWHDHKLDSCLHLSWIDPSSDKRGILKLFLKKIKIRLFAMYSKS